MIFQRENDDFFVKQLKWISQKVVVVVDVIVVGSAFSFPLAVVSVADLSLQKLCHLVQKRNSKLVCAMWLQLHCSLTKKRIYILAPHHQTGLVQIPIVILHYKTFSKKGVENYKKRRSFHKDF